MNNKIRIEENEGIDQTYFNVVSESESGEVAILAKCWDYFLAERIRDAVESYIAENSAISTDNG